MSKNILSFLSEKIPATQAISAIAKINPQINSFLSAAAAAGYGANEIQNFMRSMTSRAPGREARRKELSGRRGKRQADVLELDKFEEEERASAPFSIAKLAAIGGAASAAYTGLQSEDPAQAQEAGQQPQKPQQQSGASFFERAMSGMSYDEVPKSARENVGKLGRRLDNLEAQQVPWRDNSVQKVVRMLKKIASPDSLLAQETERFEQGYPQTEQAPQAQQSQQINTDDQFLSILDEFTKRFLG